MYTPNCCTDTHLQITRYYNSRSTLLSNDWHNSNILIYKKTNMFTCPYVGAPIRRTTVRVQASSEINKHIDR